MWHNWNVRTNWIKGVAVQLSLWHPKSCQHLIYGMTCTQYEGLRRRAQDLCELCGECWHPLVIDHDHRAHTGLPEPLRRLGHGHRGVRGLVCPKCNSHMRFVDSGERPVDERTARYLANAWHLTNVPPEVFHTPDPEPPFRAVVKGPQGHVFKRLKRGWVAVRLPKYWSHHRSTVWTWEYLSHRWGPQNLHRIDY